MNVASTANSTLTLLYRHIGKRIGDEVLKGARADYGQEILATLSQDSAAEFSNGYSYPALTRMVEFVGDIRAEAIVATLRRQSSGRTQVGLSPNAIARSFRQRSAEFRRPMRRLAVSRPVAARWRFDPPTFSTKLR